MNSFCALTERPVHNFFPSNIMRGVCHLDKLHALLIKGNWFIFHLSCIKAIKLIAATIPLMQLFMPLCFVFSAFY